MISTKRISDLESSVLYLENRNSALEEQVQKSVETNEQLSERLDLMGKFFPLKVLIKQNFFLITQFLPF